jgi:hypothetical protein
MAWQRRMSGIAGPLSASGEASNGNPVQVELFINGVWIDITSYVMVRDDSGNVTISRGRKDEGSETEQSSCGLLLNNRDGRFSPRNPTGVYYGLIGRNQPLRVSVPNGLGGKSYRFWGDVSTWPQGWDPTGTDVWTDVQGSGVLRRLAQAPASAYSVLRTALTSQASDSLRAYWPCEDPADSSTAASALITGSPMTFSGTPTFAAYDAFPASDPVVDLTDASMTGGVPKYDDPTATQVRFLLSIPSDGLTNGKVICSVDQLDYSAGSTQFWELYYNTTTHSLTIVQCASDGTNLGSLLDHSFDVRGKKMYVSIEFQESGTGITRAVRIVDLSNMISYVASDTPTLTQLTRVTKVAFGAATRSVATPAGTRGLPTVAIGHVSVESTITAIDILGLHLNPIGETAGRRVQRLCSEEGMGFDAIGDLDDTVLMGNQGKQNRLDLMQESELADGGMLYENLNVLGLGYRTRNALCNQDAQLTLNYAAYNLSEVPTPVEDDRYVQNQVTVTVNEISQTYTMTEGHLSTALPPAGVGVYGQDVSLNLKSSSDALSQAAWRVHLGTVDEARFPQISVNLAHSTFTTNPALKVAVLGLRQGDRIVIQNPPAWLPSDDIDQIILGFDETITYFEHRITFTCAPASPYRVGVFENSSAIIDTDGSELRAAVSSGSTTIDVVPSGTHTGLWTTDSTNMPFDIRVGGEVMRVSGITPYLNDTFGRTVSNGWGTADTGQAWSTGGGVAGDYSVGSSAGSHILSTTNASRRSFTDSTVTDFDFYVDVTASALATGGFLAGGPVGRYVDSDNLYMARLEFSTTNTIILTLRKRVNTNETVLGTYTLTDVFVAGTYYRVRFKSQGTSLKAKAWLATDAETPEWQISVSDSDVTTASFIGIRSISSAANTNVNPVISYQNLKVVNPQTFTVSRSVNGVVKSQVAGEDVRLAHPIAISL